MISIDLTKPVYRMSPNDRKALNEDDDGKACAQIGTGLLRAAVQLKWPQGMDGKDGKVWGRILDQLADEPATLEVTEADFKWLYKVYTDEGLKFAPAVQNWRSSLEEYLDGIVFAQKKADEKAEAKAPEQKE